MRPFCSRLALGDGTTANTVAKSQQPLLAPSRAGSPKMEDTTQADHFASPIQQQLQSGVWPSILPTGKTVLCFLLTPN